MKVKCKNCNKEFEVDNRKFNLYNKHNWNFYCKECGSVGRRKRITYICAKCGKEFERIASAKRSISGLQFCSKSCAASYNNSHYRTGRNNPNYIDGSYKGSTYSKLAFRTYIHKCAMCGLEEECCLQVHHIDENRENNNVDNLIILCANCHSRIHRGNFSITKEIINNRELV